jgi:hypothetical protein
MKMKARVLYCILQSRNAENGQRGQGGNNEWTTCNDNDGQTTAQLSLGRPNLDQHIDASCGQYIHPPFFRSNPVTYTVGCRTRFHCRPTPCNACDEMVVGVYSFTTPSTFELPYLHRFVVGDR